MGSWVIAVLFRLEMKGSPNESSLISHNYMRFSVMLLDVGAKMEDGVSLLSSN